MISSGNPTQISELCFHVPTDFMLCIMAPCHGCGWQLIFTWNWEVKQPGQMTWTNQLDIWWHMMSCPVDNRGSWLSGGFEAWGQSLCWVLGGEQLHCASFASNVLLPVVLLLLLHLSLFYSVELYLSKPLSFFFQFSCPPTVRVRGIVSHMLLHCCLSLNHKNPRHRT